MPSAGTARRLQLDDGHWLDFAQSHPDARPYHHPAWTRTISETYGFEAFVLALESGDGRLRAGVPAVSVGGRVRRRRWISLPFTDSLPPLSTNGSSLAEFATLAEAAARDADVSAIEIRAPLGSPGAHEHARGVEHILELADPDAIFAGFQSQMRRNVRKAEKSGVTVRVAEDERDLTQVYFGLHAETRRRLGVPTQPRRFFAELWRNMLEPGLGFLLLAYHEQEPVAGAVFLDWNQRVVYKFGASAQRFWPLRPNNLVMWEAIRRACDRGAHEFDFGRSDLEDEGLRSFKAGWGAAEQSLVYTTLGREPRGGGQGLDRLLRPVLRHAPVWFGRGVGAVLYRFAA